MGKEECVGVRQQQMNIKFIFIMRACYTIGHPFRNNLISLFQWFNAFIFKGDPYSAFFFWLTWCFSLGITSVTPHVIKKLRKPIWTFYFSYRNIHNMYTLFASQFPFTHIFKTSSFFFYLKFCFGTVVKNIVKLDFRKLRDTTQCLR